jgi:hypothetical protein
LRPPDCGQPGSLSIDRRPSAVPAGQLDRAWGSANCHDALMHPYKEETPFKAARHDRLLMAVRVMW